MCIMATSRCRCAAFPPSPIPNPRPLAPITRGRQTMRLLLGTQDTILMFSRAAGVVLFHGAALSNLIFASDRCCVAELSTFMDDANRQPWRLWCYKMALWSPVINCSGGYLLPHSQMMSAPTNVAMAAEVRLDRERCSKIRDSHRRRTCEGLMGEEALVAKLPSVVVYPSDIERVAAQVGDCMSAWSDAEQ
jgi:hypothetical protein